jgi:nucleoside 2-deoxyribosyltransferase
LSVYLAGPAVFRGDAEAHGASLKRHCTARGLEPLWPLDNEPKSTSAAELAREIRQMNCAMIERAAAVIAEISPFRGPNMDPGTAFEIGYAVALKKPVFVYTDTPGETLLDRTKAAFELRKIGAKHFDADDMEVEDFGLHENLMIVTVTETVYGSFEEALDAFVKAGRGEPAATHISGFQKK